MTHGFRFLKCPSCSKRGVKWAAYGADNFYCRYCAWYTFIRPNIQSDLDKMEQLRQVNPGDAALRVHDGHEGN